MSNIKNILSKTLVVDGRDVHVYMRDEGGAKNPHQVVIGTEIEGIKKEETYSYPAAAVVNRDCQYHDFDQKKAEKFVDGFFRFLGTKKGAALASE